MRQAKLYAHRASNRRVRSGTAKYLNPTFFHRIDQIFEVRMERPPLRVKRDSARIKANRQFAVALTRYTPADQEQKQYRESFHDLANVQDGPRSQARLALAPGQACDACLSVNLKSDLDHAKCTSSRVWTLRNVFPFRYRVDHRLGKTFVGSLDNFGIRDKPIETDNISNQHTPRDTAHR